MPEFACSRYNILISLRGGRTLAYNAMGGASAVWEEMDAEVFQSIERGEEIDATTTEWPSCSTVALSSVPGRTNWKSYGANTMPVVTTLPAWF